jgi:hypothetical protein
MKLGEDKIWVCLLSFDEESVYFKVSIQKLKGQDIQNCNLPVALCGCETWSMTPREERKLRVSENRVLRSIFGPMRDDVIGEWT